MPFLQKFGVVKKSRAIQDAAACKDSDEFSSLVNEATDILLQRGDWPGTVVPIRVMVRQGCVVWPRYVQRVRKINRCNIPIKVGSIWWDFVDHDSYLNYRGDLFYGTKNISGYSFNRPGQQHGQLSSQGRVPTYNDIPGGTSYYVRAYALDPSDKGKTITLFGIDGNGQTLRHQDPATGLWIDGTIIVLDIPFGSTSVYVQRIDAVIKDETQFNVPIFAYDPVGNTLLDLAIYEPGETNPSYAKDRLFSHGHTFCKCEFTVIAMVKLAFIPVKVDTDFVLIPSAMALKTAIQSIKFGESGDAQNQQVFLQSAVNELNRVLDNEQPLQDTPVNEGFMGESDGIGLQNVL